MTSLATVPADLEGDWKCHARNISIAALGAIPVVGGSLATIFDKYLPDFVARRRDEMIERLAVEIHELQSRLTAESLASDEFLAVFVKCMRRAVEEHAEEKLVAFRAIILNTALPHASDFDEVTLFIRLVSDMTLDQIRILRLVADGDNMKGKDGLLLVTQALWPEADRDYLVACTTELLRYNLVLSGPARPHEHGGSATPGQNHRLTSLGVRFLAYITSPSRVVP